MSVVDRKFARSEFAEWRNMPLTQALMESLAEVSTQMATEILTRNTVDTNRDQYLKGILQGISLVGGWTPAFQVQEDDDGNPVEEEEDED